MSRYRASGMQQLGCCSAGGSFAGRDASTTIEHWSPPLSSLASGAPETGTLPPSGKRGEKKGEVADRGARWPSRCWRALNVGNANVGVDVMRCGRLLGSCADARGARDRGHQADGRQFTKGLPLAEASAGRAGG